MGRTEYMNIFNVEYPVVGMIHLLPLPGAPLHTKSEDVIKRAVHDYQSLREGGVDAVIIENFGDAPYFKDSVEPQTLTWMTKVIFSLNIDIPFGVNVLRNDCKAALAIAHAVGGHFVRCNILSGVMVTDQGLIEGKACNILRYRNLLHSDVEIWADILVKHASPLTDHSIEYAARDTVSRGLADAVIVTGSETGEEPRLQDLSAAKNAVPHTFLFAGSGVNTENVESMLKHADGCIVGKAFKKGGKIENPVDAERVKEFMKIVSNLR